MTWPFRFLLPVLLLAVSCGGQPEFPPGHTPEPVILFTPAPLPEGMSLSLPTATAHPTFTPVPTAIPTLPVPSPASGETYIDFAVTYTQDQPLGPGPGAGADASVAPVSPAPVAPTEPGAAPTGVPQLAETPAVSPGIVGTPPPTAGPTPTRTAFIRGSSPADGAFILHHTFFPTVIPDLPEAFDAATELDQLPPRYRVVTAAAHSMHWLVFYDISRMSDSWSGEVFVRWYSLRNGAEFLIVEQPYLMSGSGATFYIRSSLGDPSGQIWVPGEFSVRLEDPRFGEVLRWDFVVR